VHHRNTAHQSQNPIRETQETFASSTGSPILPALPSKYSVRDEEGMRHHFGLHLIYACVQLTSFLEGLPPTRRKEVASKQTEP